MIRRSKLALSFFTAMFGVVYCLASGLGGSSWCGISGCEVYDGYSFLGLSFYYWGAIGFAAVGALVMFGASRWARLFASALLIADIVFLLYMALFWPCESCLIVALLLAILFSFCSHPVKPWGRALLVCWLCLFFFNALQAGMERIEPWAVHAPEGAEMTLYFSPTCSSCKDTLMSVLDHEELFENTRLIPIAQTKKDQEGIIWMRMELCNGTDAKQVLSRMFEKGEFDVDHAKSEENACLKNKALTRLALFANRHVVSQKGWTSVPRIESEGGEILAGRQDTEASQDAEASDDAGGCSIFEEETSDCD